MLKKMVKNLLSFRHDESGAVTLDFVVLVATIVLLGLAVVGAFDGEVVRISNEIADTVGNQKTR